MVCDGVRKMVCDKVVCERWCVKKWCERWCVTKWCERWCVKDGVSKMMCDKVVCERSSDPESHPKVGFESVSGFGFRVSGFVD